ncbi:MAG: hypothetical protein H0V89_01840, partial [Deltaproteobacteria bacterium]|nr:hypothetical protein [Deltaproteobacteria bacterium]
MFLMALFVPSSLAATWPQEADWVPFAANGAALTDVCGDFAGNDDWDIIGDPVDAASYYSFDGTDYFFRLRVGGDPTQSASAWTNFEWSIGFETDFDAANPKYDYSIVLDGGSETVTLYENTVGSDDYTRDDAEVALGVYVGAPSTSTPGVDPGANHAGELNAASSLCGGDDYFIDVWVPGAELQALTGIMDIGETAAVVFNSTNGTWKDTAGCDGTVEDCGSWTAA